MSNFEKNAIDKENQTLKYYTSKSNIEQTTDAENKQIFNMSLSSIAANISVTIISIINELLDPNRQGIVQIFFKEDRMVYIGLTILLVSLGLYIIDITS